MRKIYLILIFIFLFFTSCSDNKNSKYEIKYSNKSIINKTIYTFGVHPLHNPDKLFEVYQPLIDYLNKNLLNVELKLEASRNYSSYDEKLFEKLRDAFEKSCIKYEDIEIRFTISIGACYSKAINLDEMIKYADNSLFPSFSD